MSQIVELINKDKIIYAHDLMAIATADQTKHFQDAYSKLTNQFVTSPDNEIRRRNLFEESFAYFKTIIPKHELDLFYIRLCVHFYVNEMNTYAGQFPVKSSDLMNFNDEISSYCVSKFTFYTPNYSATSIEANLNLFSRDTNKLLNDLIHANNSKIDAYNVNESVKLWNTIYGPKLNKYKSVNELFLDLIRFKSQFSKYQFDSRSLLTNYFWMRFEQIIDVKHLETQIKSNNYY